MKTFKNIFAAIALVAVLSVSVNAQVTSDVQVSAQVNAALVLTPTAVVLGSIQQAASDLAANANDGSSTNVGTTATPGALLIAGTSGASVNVTWTGANLSNGTALEDAAFTPSVFNGATGLASGDDVTLTGGSVTLDVGGSLAAPGGTGAYTSDTNTHASAFPITFTVQYN